MQTHTQYIEVVRAVGSRLPRSAFRPQATDLLHVAGHFLLCALGWFAIRSVDRTWVWFIAALVIGHSIFCVGNIGHMLSHRSIVRTRWLRYPLELACFVAAGISPTVWRFTHNHLHHKHTNARGDALYQRRFTKSERRWWRTAFSLIFLPSERAPWNPTVLLGLLPASVIDTAFVLGAPSKLRSSPSADHWYVASAREKVRVLLELGLQVSLHVALFRWMRADSLRYLFAGGLPLLVSSAFAMAYIGTQHMGRPVTERHEPLLNSQSIVVAGWIDWLHRYVSHHAEHHLFPSMNPRHFPAVRKLLLEHYPAELDLKTFTACWSEIFRAELYGDDPSGDALNALLLNEERSRPSSEPFRPSPTPVPFKTQ